MHADSPTPPLYRYTLWTSLFDIDRPTDVCETWEQLTARFSNHAVLGRKDAATGFGPYRLTPPHLRCYKHRDGQPRDHAHRCDGCVAELTLAVFDADAGDDAAVAACRERLADAGVAQHWYSSYSHRYNRGPAYRLILPLDRPVAPGDWPHFRTAVIERYGIPADPRQCAGRSHFYYAPSCPPPPSSPEVHTAAGRPLAVAEFLAAPRRAPIKPPPLRDDYEEPDDPPTPVDLEPLRKELRRRLTALQRNPAETYKAQLLARLLRGEPLAASGGRNAALLAITGMLAYAIPGEAVDTYCRLMHDSMEAMIAAGTGNTWSDVERMLRGAMRCKYLEDQTKAAIAEMWNKPIAAARAALKSY
jgi:hypothetical protein